MKNGRIIFLSFFLISCIAAPVKQKREIEYKGEKRQVVAEFNEAYDLLGDENFKDAAHILENLEEKSSDSQLRLIIKFNLASAYEGMGECKKAGRKYREVVRRSVKAFPKIEAEALLRLSYAYECLGAHDKVATTLLDAWQRKKYLSLAKINTEIPARLGMAYMRIGENKSARKFFILAEKGLKDLPKAVRRSKDKLKIVSQAFYFMGKPEFRSFKFSQYKIYLRALDYQQKYLLKSVELDDPKWSVKAAHEIMNIYKFMIKIRDSWPLAKIEDRSLAQKRRRDQQKDFSVAVLTKIENLRRIKFPDAEEPIVERGLFQKLSLIEKDFKLFIQGQSQKTPLTHGAKKRQGLKYFKPEE